MDVVAGFGVAVGVGPGRRVWVVEDDLGSAAVIVEWLRRAGCSVDHSVGVSLLGDRLLDRDGREIDLPVYDTAVLDHYFPGNLTGSTLAPILRNRRPGMAIVGISSVEDANRRMREAGAGWSVRKAVLVTALRDG